ncbi:MAG: hypothetical protein KGL39_55695 [Patescibacteria group bacterium]|nr:hypothetical protein [Patescibacteria group bacterium]
MGSNDSILFVARELVRTQPWSAKTEHLRNCADQLQAAWNDLMLGLTRENATVFVAMLTRTLLAIDAVPGAEPPVSQGGRVRVKNEAPKSSTAAFVN